MDYSDSNNFASLAVLIEARRVIRFIEQKGLRKNIFKVP